MLEEEIKNAIKNYPDFPSNGIQFKDILPIFEDTNLLKRIITSMASKSFIKDADAIIAIDARGFLLGSPISMQTSKPLILARKPGKLPGELITQEYDLEYGSNSLSLQKDSILKFKKFVIVDDLLATGGTVNCVKEILKKNKKNVVGLSVLIELSELRGKERFDFPVAAEVAY
tara:strand:- start:2130 stop:2648 length:519 start_codon:yes stop_codon:yes gene_type:complete